MEKDDNIRFLCLEHSNQRHKEWQQNNKDTVIEVGNYAKMAFKSAQGIEHMWVKITNCMTKNSYIGILYNDPIRATHLKHGEEILFEREMIEEIL